MPFRLCNTPATFQRCMLAIFHDMIEVSVKVFMDDFSVFGNSFDECLNNLDKMLQRCKDAHLFLNKEKCHFMVKEGIVLGHKVSSAGLEVDKAKIDIILKVAPPTNIKGAFHAAYKTPTGTTPYKFIYGKNCHLPFEIEHHAYWALKNCNPDLIAAGEKRMFQLHELDEFRHQAYENSRLYKARTKVWHDRKLRMRKEFKHGNKVLLFHSKYKFKQPKLRSRWLEPYVVKYQYPSGYVELYGKDGKTFIVNGHRLKLYHEEEDYNDPKEEVTPFFPKE
ncbi:reverse transcriptase domain-containing protein [Tanacetum coccineum]